MKQDKQYRIVANLQGEVCVQTKPANDDTLATWQVAYFCEARNGEGLNEARQWIERAGQ